MNIHPIASSPALVTAAKSFVDPSQVRNHTLLVPCCIDPSKLLWVTSNAYPSISNPSIISADTTEDRCQAIICNCLREYLCLCSFVLSPPHSIRYTRDPQVLWPCFSFPTLRNLPRFLRQCQHLKCGFLELSSASTSS
jgi:hypothetical protein